MPRKQFERDMMRLHQELTDMAGSVDRVMARTIRSIRIGRVEDAQVLAEEDQAINEAEHRIEQMCLNLIALQQPLAGDLRHIVAALKIITDMERISDQCVDICEILSTVPATTMKVPARLTLMFEKAREMFAASIDAYIRADTGMARDVIDADDVVDDLFSRLILEMCNLLAENENPSIIPRAADFMFIGKYIERIADHAALIAEWAIYLESGQHTRLNMDRPQTAGGGTEDR